MRASVLIVCLLLLAGPPLAAGSESGVRIHGLWVWRGPSVLETEGSAESLRDFCRAQGINEVYVSISERGQTMTPGSMSRMLRVLHRGNLRVEALLSSENADEGGAHLDKLLRRARAVLEFNREHPAERFDGIHLDIEPQQRSENKGAGNLRFLPGLVEAYRAVRRLAEPSGLTVNADIQNKLLKGSPEERHMLLSALPRFTLMMYEVSNPHDGDNAERKREKVRAASERFLGMAYDGLTGPALGGMVIALRTPDYDRLLPQMLRVLDEGNSANPHYLGWARHSYNDALVSKKPAIPDP